MAGLKAEIIHVTKGVTVTRGDDTPIAPGQYLNEQDSRAKRTLKLPPKANGVTAAVQMVRSDDYVCSIKNESSQTTMEWVFPTSSCTDGQPVPGLFERISRGPAK